MIHDLAAFRVPALLISGGEPLLRPDILELAEYATARGVRVSISTNGTLITDQIAERLHDIGVSYVGVAIAGNEEVHDRVRGRSGAFRAAVGGIRRCRQAGVRVGVRFTATGDNIDCLPDILDLVEQEDIARLCVYHVVYAGQFSYLSAIDLTAEEKRLMMDSLIARTEEWIVAGRDVEVFTANNHADSAYVYMHLRDNDGARAAACFDVMQANGGNRSGIAMAAIDSEGTVFADQFTVNHPVGSIRRQPFSEIWSDPRNQLLSQFRDRKPLITGRCARCRWLSTCNANVRARSEAATGDLWASDPACYLADDEIALPVKAAV
jgi:radical SAM protein with 4Fe4S-binding SPASM domain